MDRKNRLKTWQKNKIQQERKRTQSGFTLVELLLVLLILATLAAIVVPKFTGRSEQAKVTAARTQIANFESVLEAFEVDNGTYPRGSNGLNDLIVKPSYATGWQGPYLRQSIPNDPWGNPYIYEYPGKHNPSGYDILSMGPDGRTGGGDDITNWSQSK